MGCRFVVLLWAGGWPFFDCLEAILMPIRNPDLPGIGVLHRSVLEMKIRNQKTRIVNKRFTRYITSLSPFVRCRTKLQANRLTSENLSLTSINSISLFFIQTTICTKPKHNHQHTPKKTRSGPGAEGERREEGTVR